MRLKWHWSKPYKIEVIITSLTEMLELPNFGHMTTFTLQFELRDKIGLVTLWAKNYNVITFFSKCLCLKKTWGSHFC